MLTQHLLERFPDQKIVILSGYNLPVYRKEAKKIGARGFISKDVEPDELLHILLTIKDGATHFPREEVFIEELTDGERKVLELVASGVRRREIAEQLFISERTVSNHLQHIFEKLQVSSTVEMITKAIKLGYIAQSLDYHTGQSKDFWQKVYGHRPTKFSYESPPFIGIEMTTAVPPPVAGWMFIVPSNKLTCSPIEASP